MPRLSAADVFCRYAEPRSPLKAIISAQVRQIKMANFIRRFGEIIGDDLITFQS
jgi:hypothetical protein